MLPFLESFSHSMEYILKKHRNILVAVDGKPGLEPVHIKKQLQEVRKKFNEEGPQVPTIDLDKLAIRVRNLWAKDGYAGLESLSFREKDNLPWIIYHGKAPQIAASAELVNGILTLLRGRWRSSIRKLIAIYLRYYDPSLPATAMIRRFIQEHLSTYNGSSPFLLQWRRRAVLLFAPAGTKITAAWLRDKGDESALEQLGLKGEAGTGNFLREVLRELIKHIANKDFPRGVPNLLSLLELKSQGNMARYPELIVQVANEFLVRTGRDNKSPEEELESHLRPFFLRHLGDPRLPGGKIRWRDVKSEARAVFIRWLSRRDLEFFFNIVDQTAGDDKWIYRRRFWEAYLPYIENTWVLLGRDASSLIKTPWMREHMRDRNFGRLTGANSDKSVFLLKIRGYVFIEWSHSGSCRIFREDRCPLEFGQKQCNSTMITGNWPDKKIDHRRSEYYQWQNELAQWIFINLGLRPASSFTLT
jgi:hypothetical protein